MNRKKGFNKDDAPIPVQSKMVDNEKKKQQKYAHDEFPRNSYNDDLVIEDSKDSSTSNVNTVADNSAQSITRAFSDTNLNCEPSTISTKTGEDVETSLKPPRTASVKPNSKLKSSKSDEEIERLEKKDSKIGEKLKRAQDKLPTRRIRKQQLVFDEEKNKTVSKPTHENKRIPISEAKWNQPKKITLQAKAVSAVTSLPVTKIHTSIQKVEHENVGVKASHKAELLAESGYHGAKHTVSSIYSYYKNRPYRHVAKLKLKSIKNKMELDYQRALRDNPKLKSNLLSCFMQKRVIKRNYATDLRNAKKAAQTTKSATELTAKAADVVTAITRRNPIFLLKTGLLTLIVFLLMSLLTMCVGVFSGGTALMGAVTYPAEFEDLNEASILYTELETDLRISINDIESNYPGYDEYRVNTGNISHNPFELMGFLSAVYQDFTYAQIETVLRSVFNEQYHLEIVPEVEIRYRTETRTGSYTDSEGNSYSYSYTIEVPYEFHILNVTLTAQPMSVVLAGRMDTDQAQHYSILMHSNGARQIIGNPFSFDWLSNVTSLYGYRIHPINGHKEFHWGIDIGLPTGTPIMAGLTGTVIAIGYDAGGYGNYVVIEDVNGIQARYAHCHEVYITPNQPVGLGDIIATVGSTGASTGAHLHMEISVGGQRLNPLFFVVTGNEGKSQVSPGAPGGLLIPPYPGEPMDDARFAAIMEEAVKHVGKPYVWGASGPNSFDCSGFVWYVLNQSGTASFSRTTAQGIFSLTTPITKENLKPGDLVFLTRTYSTTDAVTHIAIYIGNGMVIHAGNPISYASMDSPFWQNHYYASGRLP